MVRYCDGPEVRVGDHVMWSTAPAVVERIVEADEVADWAIGGPGFLIACGPHRILVEQDSADWEDVSFVGRRA